MSVRLTTPRARLVGVLVVALAVTIFGVTRLVSALGAPEPAPAGPVASLDSLTTQINAADWLSMDHDMSAPGYQMPQQMMPGAPEHGQQRLAVRLSVTNSSADTRPLQPTKEFTLHSSKDGTTWSAHSGTFGDLPRLAPRNAVDGILFFDVPVDGLAGGATWIEWTRGGTSTRLSIPLNGAAPDHSHTP